jgi:hypothetical protein
VEHLQRAVVSGYVQLVPRASVESVARVRPDLGCDAERAQKAERAASDRRIANVEVHRDLAATLQVHATRRVKEPRELCKTIALAARRDRRELVPEVLRE